VPVGIIGIDGKIRKGRFIYDEVGDKEVSLG
jgi:hypothetical protein